MTGRTRLESSEAVNFIEKNIGMLGTITVSVSKRRKENERGQLRLMAQLLQITAIPLTIVWKNVALDMAWIYIINGANPAGIHLFGYANFTNNRDWFSAVGSWITWSISSWEKNNCRYKLSNWQNDNYFHLKWQVWAFWVKIVVILCSCSACNNSYFVSAWDKSRDSWANSQKTNTDVVHLAISAPRLFCFGIFCSE